MPRDIPDCPRRDIIVETVCEGGKSGKGIAPWCHGLTLTSDTPSECELIILARREWAWFNAKHDKRPRITPLTYYLRCYLQRGLIFKTPTRVPVSSNTRTS